LASRSTPQRRHSSPGGLFRRFIPASIPTGSIPERDFAFHKARWQVSGNGYLVETLERLMAPLILSCSQAGAADGRYGARAYALGELQPAEFGNVVRKTLTGFALRSDFSDVCAEW